MNLRQFFLQLPAKIALNSLGPHQNHEFKATFLQIAKKIALNS